nr:hypothetical protein [Rahnella ecdela]
MQHEPIIRKGNENPPSVYVIPRAEYAAGSLKPFEDGRNGADIRAELIPDITHSMWGSVKQLQYDQILEKGKAQRIQERLI